MIIQIHTPEGIINLDTEKNKEEEFAKYGLNKKDYQLGVIDGTFTTADGKTITVADGQITNII